MFAFHLKGDVMVWAFGLSGIVQISPVHVNLRYKVAPFGAFTLVILLLRVVENIQGSTGAFLPGDSLGSSLVLVINSVKLLKRKS